MQNTVRKIGFNVQTDEESSQSKDVFRQMEQNQLEAFKLFMNANYKLSGSTEEKEFISSIELQYKLSETVDVSLKTINNTLTTMGFQIKFIEGSPYWLVYCKEIC